MRGGHEVREVDFVHLLVGAQFEIGVQNWKANLLPMFYLNPVSAMTTPCHPPMQPVGQSGTKRDDAMSVDQLETTNDYDQIW